jgi:hypothetical protein
MLYDQLLAVQMRIFLWVCELEMQKVGRPASRQIMDNMANTWRTASILFPGGK